MVDLDGLIYGVLPYVSLTLFVGGLVYRWLRHRFEWAAMSTQIFETRVLGQVSVLLHYSIIVLLIVHIIGAISLAVAEPAALRPVYVVGAIAGVLALYACLVALIRRVAVAEVRATSKAEDYIVLVLLAIILSLGLYQYVAVGVGGLYPVYARWLASIAIGQPDIDVVRFAPWWVKLHTTLALIFIAYWPFTKLAGMISYPITYITRRYQIIRRQWRSL
jgi:nitrate reductase gamma subunit